MSCIACRLAGQFLLNALNLADHALNWVLLGDADETVSARTARARVAGSRAAAAFCRALTWGQIVVTIGRVREDHCDYALDKMVRPNSREIWDWCENTIRTEPLNIVDPIEDLAATYVRKEVTR